MKILFVCHRFPYPPNRGGKIRPFNVINHFHQNGHEVHVASLSRATDETEAAHGIAPHCTKYYVEQVNPIMAWIRMLLRLPLPTPSSMGYFYSPRLKKRIQQLLSDHQYDLIFVHCSSVAQYVEDVENVPKIIDFGDMDSQKWLIYAKTRTFPLTLGYFWEGKKMERAEKILADKFDLASCTTRMELSTLDEFGTARQTDWFPNGVNLDFFEPSAEPYDPDMLGFVGRMDYYPNQEAMIRFCRNVLPLLQTKRPATKLQIIGASPSKNILALGQLPGVTVTGSVPDVRPFALKSAVSIAPLKIARGTQNKILESMAMGLPVVASTEACKGVDAIPGEHILAADTPDEYVDHILRLLESPERRSLLANAGRERALSNHNWPASMQEVDRIVSRIAST